MSKLADFWKTAKRDGVSEKFLKDATHIKIPQSEAKAGEVRRSERLKSVRDVKAKAAVAAQVTESVAPEEPTEDEKVPATIGQARKSVFWKGFEEAINTEITQLEKNNTWEYVCIKDIDRKHNILRSKLVFDIKRGPTGKFSKFKARLVALITHN